MPWGRLGGCHINGGLAEEGRGRGAGVSPTEALPAAGQPPAHPLPPQLDSPAAPP